MYIETHFSVSSPPLSWSQAVVYVSMPKMYLQNGYFQVINIQKQFLKLVCFNLKCQHLFKRFHFRPVPKVGFGRSSAAESVRGLFEFLDCGCLCYKSFKNSWVNSLQGRYSFIIIEGAIQILGGRKT